MHFAKHTKYANDSYLGAKAKLSPSSCILSQICKLTFFVSRIRFLDAASALQHIIIAVHFASEASKYASSHLLDATYST